MRIAVIADDLTGALDTGVQFTQWGFTAQLTTTPKDSSKEVTIINTDTRNKSPEYAYHKTYQIALKLDHDFIYKKTDSTLRGNPGSEIQAILDATSELNVVFTPTYPSTGRRVKDGHLYIKEKPITETEYINEYRRKTSYIPELLDTVTPIHIIKDPVNIHETGISLIDSETEQDLLKIAAHHTRFYAGSAGLADALCQVLRNPPPVLSVIGSMRTETRAQTKLLRKRLGAKIIPLNTIKALNRVLQSETVQMAESALKQCKDIILTSTSSQTVVEKTMEEAKRLRLSLQEVETRILDALATITEHLLHNSISGVILSGGATVLAITEKLDIKNIEILDEVQPGVPVLKIDHIPAITKAGGFGQPDILIQATKYLKRKYK
jgi:uncharacterized protein YgbK (DUF1537 family)